MHVLGIEHTCQLVLDYLCIISMTGNSAAFMHLSPQLRLGYILIQSVTHMTNINGVNHITHMKVVVRLL